MAEQHLVTENIDSVMRGGLEVYDADGEKIGSVRDYSNAAGYVVVQTGLIAHKELYVPYSAIRSIDPHDIFLTLRKAALVGDYSAPPPATIVVDDDTATTIVPDGYDGRPAEFHSVDLELVRRRLAGAMTVYANDGDKVGTVDGFDLNAGYMLVKRHLFSQKDLFIPFAAITSIDREYGVVYLAVSKDVLEKDYARMPDGTILRIDAVAPGVDLITGSADERTGR